MKNVKLIVLTVSAILFLGMGNVNAQEKSTVLVRAFIYANSAFTITTIKPDYTSYELKSKSKEDDSFIALKRELDKWILEGYTILNSTVFNNISSNRNEAVYFLTKEE